jgi:phosphoglycerate dehydrogenase-like enzyme
VGRGGAAAALAGLLVVGAACAGPSPSGAQELVYLASDLSDSEIAALREVAPDVRIVSGLDSRNALEYAGQAQGVDAALVTEEFLRTSPNLRWIQSWSAGVERVVGLPGLQARDEVVLTNMAGMYGPVIAEHVFAMLLSRTRNLPAYLDADREGQWRVGDTEALTSLQGRTMLVVGLGGIGTEVATRAHAFGMRVLATARTPRPAPEYVEVLGVAEDLEELLPEADIIVVAVPLTEETRGMFDAATLGMAKRGAWLVNIARGGVVDTDALLNALEEGRLGAAFLDVTDPEPLPQGHPLWGRGDVFVTPHVAGYAALSDELAWDLFRENVRRFAAGEALLNVVDKEAGY